MESFKKSPNEGAIEKASRWLRNINALGAVAFGGVGILVESAILTTYGAFNAAQAVFFEMTRRLSKKKTTKQVGKTATSGSNPHWRPLAV